MNERQLRIIENIRNLESIGYGEYRTITSLKIIIANEMGWKIHRSRHSNEITFANENGEWKKYVITKRHMVEKGIIKLSRNGKMFKLLV